MKERLLGGRTPGYYAQRSNLYHELTSFELFRLNAA